MFTKVTKNKIFVPFFLVLFVSSNVFAGEDTSSSINNSGNSTTINTLHTNAFKNAIINLLDDSNDNQLALSFISLVFAVVNLSSKFLTKEEKSLIKNSYIKLNKCFATLLIVSQQIKQSTKEENTDLITDLAIIVNNAPISCEKIKQADFKYILLMYLYTEISKIVFQKIINKVSHSIFFDKESTIKRKIFRIISNSLSAFLTATIFSKLLKEQQLVMILDNKTPLSTGIKYGFAELLSSSFIEFIAETPNLYEMLKKAEDDVPEKKDNNKKQENNLKEKIKTQTTEA